MDDASGDADTDTDNFIFVNKKDNMYKYERYNLWCEDATGCAFLCIWETEKLF
ncbi:MAG: hypothetical protein J1E83_10000 [Lachnospiraceae bacterium]|nr:hypothetical protein [Lachnospiraceae bacterium]